MIEEAPSRYRFYDRWFTVRRDDLARIAAVVHAMCDRDDVTAPRWVSKHRARHPIGIVPSLADPRNINQPAHIAPAVYVYGLNCPET